MEEPEEVAAKMDGLINDLKGNATKIAVSSIIERQCILFLLKVNSKSKNRWLKYTTQLMVVVGSFFTKLIDTRTESGQCMYSM